LNTRSLIDLPDVVQRPFARATSRRPALFSVGGNGVVAAGRRIIRSRYVPRRPTVAALSMASFLAYHQPPSLWRIAYDTHTNHLDRNDPEGEMRESKAERSPIHWPRVFGVVLLIALLGAGAVAWHYSGTEASKPSGSSAAPREAYVPLKDFERYQQAAAADVQSSKDKLQEQDAKIKQLSDQIAQLNATLNALQASARDARASAQPAQKAAKKQ
jgi:hypothetical protein